MTHGVLPGTEARWFQEVAHVERARAEQSEAIRRAQVERVALARLAMVHRCAACGQWTTDDPRASSPHRCAS